MADVIVQNGDSEEVVYEGVEAVELVSEEEGETESFVKLPDVTADDNNKVLGVAGGVWSKMNAPHPSTHPASMITGLAPVATIGSYKSLVQTPFGESIIVPYGSYTQIVQDDGTYMQLVALDSKFTAGDVCVVEWDGTEYTSTAKDGSALGVHAYLGNAYLYNNATGEDTGEPFCVVCSDSHLLGGGMLGVIASGSKKSVTVYAYLKDVIRKIDSKYLPDGIATEEYVKDAIADIEGSSGSSGSVVTERDILPEQDVAFADSDGVYGGMIDPPVYMLIEGEKYIVVWDGVAYECTCSIMNFNNSDYEVIGNKALLGGENTGEPFGIGSVSNQETGEIYGNVLVSADTEASHTVRIYQTEDVKYLPGPPEFDLTAMGLPALTMDGSTVSVECDTAELMTALEENVVKFSFTANVGTEMTVTGVVNAMKMGGDYQCGFIGCMSGTPMLLNFTISTSTISGQIIQLTAATTT